MEASYMIVKYIAKRLSEEGKINHKEYKDLLEVCSGYLRDNGQ